MTLYLEATVPSGLERIAAEEILEKLSAPYEVERGRVFFYLPTDRINEALTLRSFDHINVILMYDPEFKFTKDKEECLKRIRSLVASCDWSSGLTAWQMVHRPFTDAEQVDIYTRLAAYKKKKQAEEGNSAVEAEETPNQMEFPSFRVTTARTGEGHAFSSPEASKEFGGEINDAFQWKVKMKNFDIEVLLGIHDSSVSVAIALTEQSLHRRNIRHFGPTTLRATICYGMLRMCKIEPNEILCDPLAGGGSIPIEAVEGWGDSLLYFLAGDEHEMAVRRAAENLADWDSALKEKISIHQWDATQLPLRNGVIDCICTDMPFGKRSGSKANNKVLYPNLLREWARVVKPNVGRAVLLTQDKQNMIATMRLKEISDSWRQVNCQHVNVGGLIAFIFLLR